MNRLLVIGYGNELRSDDGVGPRIARAAAAWNLPDLESMAVHQLTPELSERLAAVERVVFVDACLTQNEAVAQPIGPGSAPVGLGHTGDPGALLALTLAVHGSYPQAWLITVPVTNLDFGQELSPAASRGFAAALQQIRLLARETWR